MKEVEISESPEHLNMKVLCRSYSPHSKVGFERRMQECEAQAFGVLG